MTDKPIATEALISIVVPIYNVEEYLPNCLDTILTQTYTNIEVLLVDDGSPDDAGAICDEYALRDERIKVFHIPNGGVAKARQLGVENSIGEYIVFVDPDDWLPLDSVEVLASSITDGVDIVVGSYSLCFSNGEERIAIISSCTYDNIEFLKLFLSYDVRTGPWGRLIKRSLFSIDSFPNIKRHQDFLMNLEIAARANLIKIIPDHIYKYRSTSETSTARTFIGDFEYYSNFCSITKEILDSANLYECLKEEYAKSVLNTLFKCVTSGAKFIPNAPIVIETSEMLKTVKLSKSDKLILMSFKSSILRSIIYRVVRFVKTNDLRRFRSVVKNVTNK